MGPKKDLAASAFYLIHTYGNVDCGPVVLPAPTIKLKKKTNIFEKNTLQKQINN